MCFVILLGVVGCVVVVIVVLVVVLVECVPELNFRICLFKFWAATAAAAAAEKKKLKKFEPRAEVNT